MTTATTFAGFLSDLMERRRLKPGQIAAYAGVSHSVVGNWRRGAQPKSENLQKLAQALNLDYMLLLRLAGHLPPTQTIGATGIPSAETFGTPSIATPERSPADAIIELAAQALRAVTPEGQPALTHDEILARLEAVGGQRVTRKIPVQKAYAHAGEEGVEGAFTYLPPEPVSETIVAVPINGGCMEPEVRRGDTVFVDVDGSPKDGDLVLAIMDADSRPIVRRYDKARAELWAEDGSEPIPFTMEMMVLPILGVHREIGRVRR